jgi:hypothetical protein
MDEADKRAIAARLDSCLPAWDVSWSPYWREFIAIAACTPEPTIIRDPVPDRLLDQMRAVQLAALSTDRTLSG